MSLLVLLLLLVQNPTGTDDAVALGDRLLRAGDAAAAAASYEEAYARGAAQGVESAALSLRLGRAYLQANRLGPAVLYLERAARLQPDDSLVTATLDEARLAVGLRPEVPPAPLTQTALALARPVGAGALFGIGWLGLLIGLALVGWRVWARDGRWAPWDVRMLAVALPLGSALVLAALLASAEVDASRGVVQQEAALGRAPGDASGAQVAAGRVVRLGERTGPWQAVELPSGTTGWLPAALVAEI